MTLNEYNAACSTASISNPFIDKSSMQTLASTVFTDAVIAQIEMMIPALHPNMELANEDADDTAIATLRAAIVNATSCAFFPKIAEWQLRVKILNRLNTATTDELAQNWNRSRTSSGRTDGGTTTDGTASRNSFDSDELVAVSGSNVTSTSGEMHSDQETESGTQGKSVAQTLLETLGNVKWDGLINDMVDTILSAIAITIY